MPGYLIKRRLRRSVACDLYSSTPMMGAGIIVAIGFFSLAGYIARLAMRGLNGHEPAGGRQRPLRHERPPVRPRKSA
jgi:hypothetical protein